MRLVVKILSDFLYLHLVIVNCTEVHVGLGYSFQMKDVKGVL